MHYIGIDLGTTHTVVTEYKEEDGAGGGKGHAVNLRVDGNEDIMPSVVAFDTDNIFVGRQALARAIAYPEQTIESIKREIGNRDWKREFLNREWTPVDISAEILKAATARAADSLGAAVTHAVITVPAYFNDVQKRRTREAAEKAGLSVLSLLSEPMAAAFHYGWDRKVSEQTLLIYDLGGGTFDTCCLEIKGNEVRELGVKGHMYLGGDNFDKEIEMMLVSDFREESGIDLEDLSDADDVPRKDRVRARRLLQERSRDIKEQLSTVEEVEVSLVTVVKRAGVPVGLHTRITRARFETAITPLVQDTLEIVTASLAAAKREVDDINRVILVGGSTKVPLVRKKVAEYFKREPFIADVARAVSKGAALFAWNLSLPTPTFKPKSITTRVLGVEVAETDPFDPSKVIRDDKFSPILGEGLELPASQTKSYSPISPTAKAISLRVFQAESEAQSTKDCIWVGEVEVSDLPMIPGVSINVTFTVNQENILEVKAEPEGGRPVEAELRTDGPHR